MPATVVLVHGAWHGAWCWERVTALLEARRIPWIALDLPTCDDKSASPATLHDDAAVLRTALDAIDGPTVVCGHSYGGFVISEGAAGHPGVRQLVYLAAFMPDEGETVVALTTSVPDSPVLAVLRPQPDGRTALDVALAADVFFNDCDEASRAWAIAHLRAMWLGTPEPAAAFAWKTIPSVFVVTGRDRTILPELQRRMSLRATRVVEWDTSHSPFFSQPTLVADLLEALARAAA